MADALTQKREEMFKRLSAFFDLVYANPMEHDVHELIVIIESIIPVHVALDINNYEEVDSLLAQYPFIYQKLVRLYAIYMHLVRKNGRAKTEEANKLRDYRDVLEELLKVVKLQYESLSRRFTVLQERRA